MKKYNFCDRHIGPREADINSILDTIGASSIQELIDQTIPAHIQLQSEMDLPKPLTEDSLIEHMTSVGAENKTVRSYIGMGYVNPALH